MPLTEIKYDNVLNHTKGHKTAAVIVAAGSSNRMKGTDKQFLAVGNIPVIARTLLKFQQSGSVDSIVVVTRQESVLPIQKLAEEYGITKVSDIVLGGETRHQSVANGINALCDDVDCVLVHDGARPFVSVQTINRVEAAAREFGASACGIKIYDTVKRVNESGIILETVERLDLIRIQTPQGFILKKYLEALRKCDDIISLPDDCALFEKAGYKVQVVEGENNNIKITTPDDVKLAEAIIEKWSE